MYKTLRNNGILILSLALVVLFFLIGKNQSWVGVSFLMAVLWPLPVFLSAEFFRESDSSRRGHKPFKPNSFLMAILSFFIAFLIYFMIQNHWIFEVVSENHALDKIQGALVLSLLALFQSALWLIKLLPALILGILLPHKNALICMAIAFMVCLMDFFIPNIFPLSMAEETLWDIGFLKLAPMFSVLPFFVSLFLSLYLPSLLGIFLQKKDSSFGGILLSMFFFTLILGGSFIKIPLFGVPQEVSHVEVNTLLPFLMEQVEGPSLKKNIQLSILKPYSFTYESLHEDYETLRLKAYHENTSYFSLVKSPCSSYKECLSGALTTVGHKPLSFSFQSSRHPYSFLKNWVLDPSIMPFDNLDLGLDLKNEKKVLPFSKNAYIGMLFNGDIFKIKNFLRKSEVVGFFLYVVDTPSVSHVSFKKWLEKVIQVKAALWNHSILAVTPFEGILSDPQGILLSSRENIFQVPVWTYDTSRPFYYKAYEKWIAWILSLGFLSTFVLGILRRKRRRRFS